MKTSQVPCGIILTSPALLKMICVDEERRKLRKLCTNQAQGLDGGHRKPSGHVPAALWGSSLLVFSVSEDDEGVLPLEDSPHGPGVNDGAPRSLEPFAL
ncbi:hypothetical protein QQF64_012703 [Cirrhinus molitorella]|uniref:Uncharacterized protein n=1 Tax=Cirrhinus molitorella TaxID=172907 RepID=A0ABR3LWD6_9TELE